MALKSLLLFNVTCLFKYLVKPALFCRLLAALGSTNKFATHPFFYFLSLLLFSTLHHSYFVTLLGTCVRNYSLSIFSLFSGHNLSPDTCFWTTTGLINWSEKVSCFSHLAEVGQFLFRLKAYCFIKIDTQAPPVGALKLKLAAFFSFLMSRIQFSFWI